MAIRELDRRSKLNTRAAPRAARRRENWRSDRHGWRFYRRILGYFRTDPALLTALVILIWLALGLGALEPAAVAILTDTVLTQKAHINQFEKLLLAPLPAAKAGQVIGLALLWLLVRFFNDSITLAREMINNKLRYNGTARARAELFDQLQRLGPGYHRANPQGDAIYRLNIDTQGFFGVLNTFVGAANSALTLIVISAVMLGWNVRITVVALGLAPLLVLANAWFGRTIRRTSALSKQTDSDLTTFTQRAMASIGLVQLFGRERSQSTSFRRAVDDTIRAGMRMNWQEQFYPLAQRTIYAIGYAFVLGYGGYLVYHGEMTHAAGAFTVGGIFAMTAYLGQLWEPLRRITGFTADVQVNAAACARVFHVLDLEPAVADRPGAIRLPVRRRVLELRDVSFAYGDGRAVLRGISARIDPGRMVAFVGASGAGKSTLLSLLPRLYDPAGGGLFLDEHDLRDIRLADVRRHIALVPQDCAVIPGTIAENIAFGNPTASGTEICEAAADAGAASFIEALPDQYETQVTEGGQNLSGGQRQRLAIARVLLTRAPILVFDEPTSGLDRQHERLVLQTLQGLRGRHTLIVVTHSLSAAAQCDHIYFLHQGQVAEQGTHEELLEQGGLYAALAAMPHRAGMADAVEESASQETIRNFDGRADAIPA